LSFIDKEERFLILKYKVTIKLKKATLYHYSCVILMIRALKGQFRFLYCDIVQ